MSAPSPTRRGSRWIDDWDPEDEQFWQQTGKSVARRNLIFSILAEHIGFSIWTMWSVLVLFLGPEYGFSAADKFLLVSTPAFVGALLRVPYTFAVAAFGGRNWTIVSAAMLLAPCLLVAVFLEPGISFGALLLIAAVGGVGGGNFASSMTNINSFYPDREKGWALGLNAGGGNIGVCVMQLVALLVIETAGPGEPKLLLWIYIPLIVLATVLAAQRMDNLATVSNDKGAARLALRDKHTYIMSYLYIGTFGSFIGYSFAFGLVLVNEFDKTGVEALRWTFLGPMIGSLIRPIGGRLADSIGGSIVTFWTFVLMAVGCVLLIVAGSVDSFGLYVCAFLLLFVCSGIGNGSTFKTIPSIHQRAALDKIAAGMDRRSALLHARRISGAAIGLISAVGALGGALINVAFRESFLRNGSGTAAIVGFLCFYATCFVLTYVVYLRKKPTPPVTAAHTDAGPGLAYAGV